MLTSYFEDMRNKITHKFMKMAWSSVSCHSKILFVLLIVIFIDLCVFVRCDAKANPNADASAEPDSLWDKLPFLQKFHNAGKKLSLQPIQSFFSPTQGNHRYNMLQIKFG